MSLSTEQVIALAPDAASVKAGKGLSSPNKWQAAGLHDTILWGACKGSGKKPYQVRVDLAETAFKCSCPSRKFPCKHALGLMLMYAADTSRIGSTDAPEWVLEWQQARQQRAEKKQAKAAGGAKSLADPKAKARREAKRMKLMQQGLEDLEVWLQDCVRMGLAELPQQSYEFWSQPAARLVDAQVPGLAAYVEQIQSHVNRRAQDWTVQALALMGRLKLMIEAFKRFEQLSVPQQADLRAVLGWALDKDLVLAEGESLQDEWQVLAIVHSETQRLRERRTCLQGAQSGRMAILLDFAYGNQPLPQQFVHGTRLQARLSFYPSAYPLRAILKDSPKTLAHPPNPQAHNDFQQVLDSHADALAGNPWLLRFPVLLSGLIPSQTAEQLQLRDSQGALVPVTAQFKKTWTVLALSGGHPITVFGEWQDNALLPLAVWSESGYQHFGATA